MPKKGGTKNNADHHSSWSLLKLYWVYSSHEILLFSFLEYLCLVFLAKVSEIMSAYKLKCCNPHLFDISSSRVEEVFVLSKYTTEPSIKVLRYFCISKDSNVWRKASIEHRTVRFYHIIRLLVHFLGQVSYSQSKHIPKSAHPFISPSTFRISAFRFRLY